MPPQFTIAFDWHANGAWVDETSHIRAVRIALGFAAPDDPVARPGVCTLTLDNTSRRFSPALATGPLYGKLRPGREVRVQVQDGVLTWTLFRGVIARLVPDSGPYGPRRVTIVCEDRIALLARARVGVPHQPTMPAAAAVADVVSRAGTPPATAYADNGDQLTHYGRTWHPEQTRCLDALREIASAVYGRFYVARDGTATFRTRTQMQDPSVDPVLSIADDPIAELVLSLDSAAVINQVQVIIHPVETVSLPADLWTSRTVLHLAPGETRTITAPFRDSSGARCGAVNVIPPQPATDYTVNERSDGSGFDYTASPSFVLSTVPEATRARLTLTNNALGPLYITSLRLRGQPLLSYDPIIIERADVSSQAAYQVRTRTVDLPLQSDPVFGEALAAYLIARRAAPALAATSLTCQDRAPSAESSIFALGLLDKVRVTDSQSGLQAVDHRVHALEYTVDDRAWTVVLHLEPSDALAGWLLDRPGYTELGVHTRLGL